MEVSLNSRSKTQTALIVLVWISVVFSTVAGFFHCSYYITEISRSVIKNNVSASDFISAYGSLCILGIGLILSVLLAVNITALYRKRAYLPVLAVYLLTGAFFSLCSFFINTVLPYFEYDLLSRIPVGQLIVVFLPTVSVFILKIITSVLMLRSKKYGIWMIALESVAVLTLVRSIVSHISSLNVFTTVLRDVPDYSLLLSGNVLNICNSALLIAIFTIIGIDDIVQNRRKRQSEMQDIPKIQSEI